MNYRRANVLVVILSALLSLAPWVAVDVAAGKTPKLSAVDPDVVLVVEPQSDRAIPASVCGGRKPSDVHAYRMNGEPYRQGITKWGDLTWGTKRRPVMVGYVKINRDVFNFTNRRVKVAAFCG